MRITIAFDVKNYVEVMEGWPIEKGDMTFFLEREGNVLKRVCLSFSGVGIEHAPSIKSSDDKKAAPQITINGGVYSALARTNIMNWQAVVSGQQIVNLDYDNYEIRFHSENVDEENLIHIKSFKTNSGQSLNSTCDFEQLGRAFCVDRISDDRIESTSHFREGRIAFEAGRYVDSYNNMFLFLETRYCEGKTGNDKQTDILSKNVNFSEVIERVHKEFLSDIGTKAAQKFNLFDVGAQTRDKIKTLVLLRGKLRHHSLKSPHRWDPNKQNEYEMAARFLGAVVGDIVIKESLNDIYSKPALQKFREISIATGNEIRIKLTTHRLEKKRTIELNMSYPTTVVSSNLCLATVRNAIKACEADNQLADTVRFKGSHGYADLELLSLDFDVWAYTESRSIERDQPIGPVRCSFEHFREGIIAKHEFSFPFQGNKLTILDTWRLLKFSFDHIERKDPTTRIMRLELFLNEGRKPIVVYRVGAQVRN